MDSNNNIVLWLNDEVTLTFEMMCDTHHVLTYLIINNGPPTSKKCNFGAFDVVEKIFLISLGAIGFIVETECLHFFTLLLHLFSLFLLSELNFTFL